MIVENAIGGLATCINYNNFRKLREGRESDIEKEEREKGNGESA